MHTQDNSAHSVQRSICPLVARCFIPRWMPSSGFLSSFHLREAVASLSMRPWQAFCPWFKMCLLYPISSKGAMKRKCKFGSFKRLHHWNDTDTTSNVNFTQIRCIARETIVMRLASYFSIVNLWRSMGSSLQFPKAGKIEWETLIISLKNGLFAFECSTYSFDSSESGGVSNESYEQMC